MAEAIGVFIGIVVGVAIAFALNALIALGIQYVSESLLHYPLPFWPTFVGVTLFGFLVGARVQS